MNFDINLTFFSFMDVDPHAAEKTKIGEYDDHYVEKTKIGEYDVGQNQYTANEIQQSARNSNLKRDSSPHVKQTTNKESGEFQRNIQIQVVTYCQGHKMSNSNSIAARLDVGIPPIISSSSKHKGNPENVLKHPDLDTNQTKPDSFTLQNVRNPFCIKHPLVVLENTLCVIGSICNIAICFFWYLYNRNQNLQMTPLLK